MADYRAFYVGSNGNVLKSFHLECMSDDTIIRKVQQLAEATILSFGAGPAWSRLWITAPPFGASCWVCAGLK
jgi:hypothetical protein